MSKHTNKNLRPESQMMSHGYNPFWSEGSLKPPIFQTSTFEFSSAEEGKAFFAQAYGKEEQSEDGTGLIYSRINNPNLEILEHRLCLWDNAEECAAFESGMAAISTVLMSFTKPGDVILCSLPVYGGSNFFMEKILPKYGIHTIYFLPNEREEEILAKVKQQNALGKISIIYVESPANPTLQLIDLDRCFQLKKQLKQDDQVEPLFVVDNTFMGPIWQKPMKHGADIVLYSATKYIGGHSDLIAGAALGTSEHIAQVKALRTFLGNMASPHTSWLLTRSLESLQVRMEKQAENAKQVAAYLKKHPLVERLHFLGNLQSDEDIDLFRRHFSSTGAMLAFEIKGGEPEAFQFLNALTLIKLAVSLGGTESLAEHPKTMTHTDMDDELKEICGVNDQLIRLSIGVEHAQDLIDDLAHAFDSVDSKSPKTI